MNIAEVTNGVGEAEGITETAENRNSLLVRGDGAVAVAGAPFALGEVTQFASGIGHTMRI